MRKLATILLLSALPLAASAAPFDNWKDAHGPAKNTLPYQFTDAHPTNFVFDTGFTTTENVTLGFALNYSDMVTWNNTAGKWESAGALSIVYSDGSGGWNTSQIFGDSKWADGVTFNPHYAGPVIIGPNDKSKLQGPNMTFAAGTDFYFVLTVNGVEYASNTATLHEWMQDPNFPMEATYVGFDVKGNGTFDNYVFAMSFTPGSVGLAPIPEPETYAMMLAGLALVGAVARRRKLS